MKTVLTQIPVMLLCKLSATLTKLFFMPAMMRNTFAAGWQLAGQSAGDLLGVVVCTYQRSASSVAPASES